MGIQGLHKGLAFCTKKTNVRDFKGQAIAVDSSSWLHKSVYSVSEKYVEAMERGCVDPQSVRVSSKYISGRCRELLNRFRIGKIFLVMDGKRCPLKSDTNDERERRRQQNLSEARDYKRKGRRDKAEDKYKTCIKIKDELTIAVMKEVARSFHNDDRVQLVWSPYEADAQLAKLCIDQEADAVVTEDSDVLVYSAASHCIFPVIFKLDRSSGNCDIICMDWLLSSSVDPKVSKKAGSALETLLLNLASRQAKRPGFGVRLFVQGCVLAGCDYAPNKLSGVGLVSAFKSVRENAFRHDSIRFAKILDSLPRKAKLHIDTAEYEAILTKSEAVFYYHLVKHQDGSVKPVSDTRLSEEENGNAHHYTDHFPFMQRFQGDWSFLGTTKAGVSSVPLPVAEGPPVAEIVIPKEPKQTSKEAAGPRLMQIWNPTNRDRSQPKNLANPYLPKKRLRESHRRPLREVDQLANLEQPAEANPFAKFARVSDKKATDRDSGIPKCFEPREDVRFVKRHFPSQTSHIRRLNTNPTFGTKRLGALVLGGKTRTRQSERTRAAIRDDYCQGNSSTLLDASKHDNHIGQKEQNTTDNLHHFDNVASTDIRPAAASLEPAPPEEDCYLDDEKRDQGRFSAGLPSADSVPLREDPLPVADDNQKVPSFFDLTDSNSGGGFQAQQNGFAMSNELEEMNRARVSVEPGDLNPAMEHETYDGKFKCGDLVGNASSPDLDFDPKDMGNKDDARHGLRSTSKYFRKDRSRRVTLDPSEIYEGDNNLCNIGNSSPRAEGDTEANFLPTANLDAFTPQTKRSCRSDEIIESPPEFEEQGDGGSFLNRSSGSQRFGRLSSSANSYSIVASYKKPRTGPLYTAFKRQKQLSGPNQPQFRSWRNSSASLGNTISREKKKSQTLDSYFQSTNQSGSAFSQLPLNTKHTDDDFLWGT